MPDPWDFYLSSPTVWNGAVYFGSSDGNVYSLDATSGALKWKFHTGDVVHSSPAIADGVLYIGSWDTYLYAMDAASGTEKWRFKTGEDPDIHNHGGIQDSPAVADGTIKFEVVFSSPNLFYDDMVIAVHKLFTMGTILSSPVVVGNTVYFGSTDGNLYALQ